MRRWRHDGEPFRSPHPQLRLDILPASVEDRYRHSREPHLRVDQPLRVVWYRRLRNHRHEGLPGQFEIQTPVRAGIDGIMYHAGNFNEQAVVRSAEKPFSIGPAGLR